MMKRTWAVAFLTLCLIVPSLCGCEWIRGACAAAVPVITVTQTYLHDATIALDQVEALFQVLPVPPDVKQKAATYTASARQALRVADQALSTTAQACTKPDPVILLKDFVQIWALIEGLLAQNSTQLAGVGQPQIQTPAVVLEARARGVK